MHKTIRGMEGAGKAKCGVVVVGEERRESDGGLTLSLSFLQES